MKIILLLVLACSCLAPAQRRILVAPNGDARPLTGRESAADVVRAGIEAARSAVCSDQGTFGYSKTQYPNPNVQFEAFHRDIMAMWYVAPASGTIDTVFVYNLDVGTQDSTVTVRIFNSNIYPGSGPGYGGYPKPGKLCWGYYLSTNDDDNGLAAFPEDATDTTWHSTVPGAIPSFTPMGSEIWGFGGFPKVMNAYSTNFIAMGELATLNVTAGQPFFITIKMYGPHVEQANDRRTGYQAVTEPDSLQTHNWKFYEHIYEGPGFTCPGWVARGEFNFLIWYSMTVTTNLPPAFSDVTAVTNTFSTADQVVQATIVDCDAAIPGRAGVETAVIRYTLNDVPQPDIALTDLGGDTWEGTIPGASVDDRISYRLVASDSTGFADSTATTSYRVVSLANGWYAADTGAACATRDIRLTGTTVPPSAFFVPPFPGAGTLPKDDGTAGPIDMGHAFTVFGDTFRYAWIGVNGGLALGKAPDDTLDVNSNGFGTRTWDFPNPQKSGRDDVANASAMPGMFIAPFWADMVVGDSAASYGRIVHGNDGDSCLFIAEWDSLGAFDEGSPVADGTTFRAVLDRCTGRIEFQYDDVGSRGLENAALVGMQADSGTVSGPEPGWIYVNHDAAPAATTPRNGWCVRFDPVIGATVHDGWNMVAVSYESPAGNYAKSELFPSGRTPAGISQAYGYSGGFVQSDSLTPGKGYWLKFDAAGRAGEAPGTLIHGLSVPVQDKWNMIGGPSGPVPTGSIGALGGTVSSSYFGYGTGGYVTASTIEPTKGYWVKMTGAGTLELSSAAAVPKADPGGPAVADPSGLSALTILDAAGRSSTLWFGDGAAIGVEPDHFELPPPPPAGAFDARFATGRFVEAVGGGAPGGARRTLPISLSGAAWPVTVSWDVRSRVSAGSAYALGTGPGAAVVPIAGAGSTVIRSEPAGGLALLLEDAGAVPVAWALGANYPNPFNPSTRFSIGVASDGPVRVAVYDLLGRAIRTLAAGPRAAGSYQIEWDGRDGAGAVAPSGVYVVRMSAGEFSASRKIILMK